MSIDISISDDNLTGMTEGAREEVRLQVEGYATELIKEANRIEEGVREHGEKEISRIMVTRAARQKELGIPKRHKVRTIIIKSCATLFLFCAGLLFDENGYKECQWKFILFVLCLVAAVTFVVLQFALED